MKQKLLLLCRNQFGYHTDSYKWCQYLRERYDITYICFDYKRPKIKMDGVRVVYVSRLLPEKLRGMILLLTDISYSLFTTGKIVVEYFPRCSWIKRALPWKRMMVDVRSMAVQESPKERKIYDNLLISECQHFDLCSAISPGVIKVLKRNDIHLLPLGADEISDTPKTYDDAIRLIYVGSFHGRAIDRTIEGIKLFKEKHPEVPVHYELIGFGVGNDDQVIKDTISNCNLEDTITFRGRVLYNELKPYLDKSNVGFSFVPMTEYFEHQPPTKTYEYAMSGIYTIATATQANKDIVTENNGVLIQDTAEGVALGLEKFWEDRKNISEANIRASLAKYSWKNICNDFLQPILDNL